MRETLSDIALYHEYKSKTDTDGLLSQRTWDDLNQDDFFLYTDHTSSCVGRQYLYSTLHYHRLSEISGYEQILHSLAADIAMRRDIQKDLEKLNNTDAYSIASLFPAVHPVGSHTYSFPESLAVCSDTIFRIVVCHILSLVYWVDAGVSYGESYFALS